MDAASQVWITCFGGMAIWLMCGDSARSQRLGVLCGCISQPAWYVQLVVHEQWLMVPVYALYTAAWIRGVRNHWIRPRREESREQRAERGER